MITCLSPNGTTVHTGPPLPDTLVIATLEGVVTAERRSGEWDVLSHSLDDRHIASLIYEPLHSAVFASSYAGGVFRSSDGGVTWHETGAVLRDHKVYSLASRVIDGEAVLYAGTEPVHLFESRDYGTTWAELPAITKMPGSDRWTFPAPPHIAHLKMVTFDPEDDRSFYVSIEQGGLFHTADGGASFVELEGVVQADDEAFKDIHRVVLHPSRPKRLFITGGDGLSVSEDGGATWRRIFGRSFTIGYPDGLVIDARDPSLMFVSGAYGRPGMWRESHSANARVARSRDGGSTWEIVGNGLPDPLRGNIEALSRACANDGAWLYAGTTDGEVYESADDGDHWQLALKGLAPISKGGHYRNIAAVS